MIQNKVIHTDYVENTTFLNDIIENYDVKGENYGNQDRNSLKLFILKGNTINVKSFRVPNFINQIAYRFFRSSKAQRSYEYANILKSSLIGTPEPIAFFEYKTALFFKKSYYISKHLEYDLTYRELTTDFEYPNHEHILRAFTRFTYSLHEKNINFLDHSPGNTLITTKDNDYKFYLVDLNRMEFKKLDFEARIRNFAKLTIHKFMIEIMSDEYAKLSGVNYDTVFELMWKATEEFQEKFHRKKRLKKKLKFWK